MKNLFGKKSLITIASTSLLLTGGVIAPELFNTNKAFANNSVKTFQAQTETGLQYKYFGVVYGAEAVAINGTKSVKVTYGVNPSGDQRETILTYDNLPANSTIKVRVLQDDSYTGDYHDSYIFINTDANGNYINPNQLKVVAPEFLPYGCEMFYELYEVN